MTQRPRFPLVILSLLAVAGAQCGKTPTSPTQPYNSPPAASVEVALTPVVPAGGWPVATPANSGVNTATLTDLHNRIRRGEFGNIDSLLVVRREHLVMEQYYNAGAPNAEHTMMSVTKSITSLATGLAVDRGLMRVSDPVLQYFPDYQPVSNMDANKHAQTIRDLLRMRTGYDWTEHDYASSPLAQINTCACDWLRFVLDYRMNEAPGSRFEYNSGGVILLAGAIGRATGLRADLLLDAQLFGPMGIQGARWDRGQPLGMPHTGGGLYLRSRDMAKLGSLVATGGRWQGQQLISEAWIRESTQMTPTIWYFGSQPAGYGYLWWGLPGGVIAGAGNGGQWLLIVPDRELVVASTASNYQSQFDAPVRMLYDYILPALQ